MLPLSEAVTQLLGYGASGSSSANKPTSHNTVFYDRNSLVVDVDVSSNVGHQP